MAKKFCDANTCIKPGEEIAGSTAVEVQLGNYSLEFLTPANVGARKGIFVPRSLVDKIGKLVKLYDVEDLTIGAYVTNILVHHLVANQDSINELTRRGSKNVPV